MRWQLVWAPEEKRTQTERPVVGRFQLGGEPTISGAEQREDEHVQHSTIQDGHLVDLTHVQAN